jgi:transcriptional regulator with XRE-family HTH domain
MLCEHIFPSTFTKGVKPMLGARIAALRRSRGWSQAELAHRLKISPSGVGMYEQGRREPPAELLVAMAEEFGVSTDFLLTGKASVIDSMDISQLLQARLEAVQRRLTRRVQSFDSQELAVLLAAMLLEP